ncbi:MAG: radical SAM protein [Myxococcota bacterium]
MSRSTTAQVSLPIVESGPKAASYNASQFDPTGLDLHRTIVLGAGYRWRIGIASVPVTDGLWLANPLTDQRVFLPVEADAVRLTDIGLLTRLEDAGFVARFDRQHDRDATLRALRHHQNQASIVNYTVAPSLRCNFSCEYCFERLSPIHLTERDADFLADHMAARAEELGLPLHISWYGGEPLLALSTIERVTARLSNSRVHAISEMLSNGFLAASAKVADRVRAVGIQHVQVPLDGPRALHEETRAPAPGVASYDRVVDGILNLHRRGIEVSVRINVKGEAESVEPLLECSRFREFANSSIRIYFATIFASGGYDRRQDLKALKHRFIDAGFNYEGMAEKALTVATCSALRDSDIIVGPELELYECYTDFGHRERVVGNLREGLPARTIYPAIQPPEPCFDCAAFYTCQGSGCPYDVRQGWLVGDPRHCRDIKAKLEAQLLRACETNPERPG